MRELAGWATGFVGLSLIAGAAYGVVMFVFGRWLIKALAEVPVG